MARIEGERFELADLVGDELALAGRGRLRALARRALVGELAPGAEASRSRAQALRLAVRIEERALRIAPEQQLVLVLPVDVHQAIAELAKLRRGRGRPFTKPRERPAESIVRRSRQAPSPSSNVARREPVAQFGGAKRGRSPR
jgi:hypothetical protein